MQLFGQQHSIAKAYSQAAHRTREPAETLAWLKPMAQEMGVTRLANVTGLDIIGVPVWLAVRPNSKGLATSQGKGLTNEAAATSALMEALESWHGENINLLARISDYASLSKAERAVDPNHLLRTQETTFRDDLQIAWIEGWDVVENEPIWVPYDSVSTNYVVDQAGSFAPLFVQSSNGLAGGNHPLEAFNHGLAEVVERHAIASCELAMRAFDPDIRLDLSSVNDARCREVLDAFSRHDVLCAVFRLQSDVDLPVFGCVIVDGSKDGEWRLLPPFNGYGCHVDANIALLRALTEAAQSRVTHISGSRDDILTSEYSRRNHPDDLARIRQQIEAGTNAKVRMRQAVTPNDRIEEDTNAIVDAITAAGYQSIIGVNLTNDRFSIPVVKSLVPQMKVPASMLEQNEPVLGRA